jgi:hypothetical protein
VEIEPLRILIGNGFQAQAQRLHDQLDFGKFPYGCHNGQAVGALEGASFEEAFVFEALEEGIKDAPLGLVSEQALAELA